MEDAVMNPKKAEILVLQKQSMSKKSEGPT